MARFEPGATWSQFNPIATMFQFKLVDGWMDGWMDGCYSGLQDCRQQPKIIILGKLRIVKSKLFHDRLWNFLFPKG